MILNDTFKIKEIRGGYELQKKIIVTDKETHKPKTGMTKTFYGNMQQALIGFLRHSAGDPETLDEMRRKVKNTITEIKALEDIVHQHKRMLTALEYVVESRGVLLEGELNDEIISVIEEVKENL